jgi:hypothetical protein
MPHSAERLLAAIERDLTPHVPPANLISFRHALAEFLSSAVPAIDQASATLRPEMDYTKPNNTPNPAKRLLGNSRIAHALMAVTTLVGFAL